MDSWSKIAIIWIESADEHIQNEYSILETELFGWTLLKNKSYFVTVVMN